MRKAVRAAALWFLILGIGTAWATGDGIWKDVPKDQPDGRFALYVQTYTTGSVVVVILDSAAGPGTQRPYAFLDDDFTDGVDADELGGADAHLFMSPLDQGSPTATLSLAGSGVSFDVHKWFDASFEDGRPMPADGIYKDTPEPMDTSFNLFLQTYDAEGSAVAIVTNDGGRNYDIFLDSDFSDGFGAVDDVLGRGAQLSFSVDSVETSAFNHKGPDGGTRAGQLYRWFQAPAVSYALSGFMTYAGTPMPGVTALAPTASAWDLDSEQFRSVVLDYDSTTGAFELRYLPANVFLSAWFVPPGVMLTQPGNYMYKKDVDIPSLSEAERAAFDIEFERILRLTSPYDTNIKAPSYSPDTHESPVTFEWEGLPDATHYELKIDRFRSAEHPEHYGYIETVLSENELQSTTYTAQLPPSEPLEHYEFYLYAFKNAARIGLVITTLAPGGYREHYRFLVVSP